MSDKNYKIFQKIDKNFLKNKEIVFRQPPSVFYDFDPRKFEVKNTFSVDFITFSAISPIE